MTNLLESRDYYKPFDYPWAYDAYKMQLKMNWIPEEASLHSDVQDWNLRLSDSEKHLLTQLFRFFTQADIDVASGYTDIYLPLFGNRPEVKMMLLAFANMEAVHIDAYSLLLETVGMPEAEYQAFKEYEAMKAKHEYLEDIKLFAGNLAIVGTRGIAKSLAVYSAFTEGLQLFSSFAILLNFPRFGKMRGMGQIVTWSIRDESLHVESMIKLFRTFVEENPEIWTDEFKAEIYAACRKMVELEDKFIDLAFQAGEIQGLTSEEVKQYIRYIADRRLLQLGLKPNYGVKDNPLPWLEEMLAGVEHANFFETTATEYSRASTSGSWENVFNI